jgi:acetylglutamate kinase
MSNDIDNNSNNKLPAFVINAFYESKFKNALFVIKASGSVIEDEKARNNLIANIRELIVRDIKVLLIYGGGKAIDATCEKRDVDVKKHNGRRITDAPAMQVVREVIGGDLSLSVFETMQHNGLDGANLNAVPADWMDVVLRPKNPIDFGFVGDITEVYPHTIKQLLENHDFIACPCLAISKDGNLCNINADTIATKLATKLKADKLIYMSNIDGVKIDEEIVSTLISKDIPKLIKDNVVTDGMRVKMENCIDAINGGVKRIHLINGFKEDALHKEIFESIGLGTMIIHEDEHENYINEIEIQKAIEGK